MESAPSQKKTNPLKGWILPLLIAGALKLKSVAWLAGGLLTMLASVWVFAQRDGLPYGISLVFLILIHELGHWIWMKASGLNPKTPMFIPGLGAFVAMQKMPGSDAVHAWVAMAGPLIGGLGCAILFAAGVHTNNHYLMTAGNTGFMLNLLQLLPAKPLDGGFIIHALSKWLLIPGTILLFIAAWSTGSSILYLIAIVSFFSFWSKPKTTVPNTTDGADAGTVPEVAAPLPATTWERVGIGVAYITLIGALAFGYLLSGAELKL